MKALCANVERLKAWLRTELPCVPGKREFSNDRYFIRSIHDAASMKVGFEEFLRALRNRQTVAGLFVISEAAALPATSTAQAQFLQCARMMRDISDIAPEQLATGGRLGKTITLECPVTGVMQDFDDFDAVAFCPQSNDLNDPLYDPMMGTPVPCVNFNSDIYAFSMFTRDYALKTRNAEVWQLNPLERHELFAQTARRWQQFALATIKGYMAITNLERCPVSLTDDHTLWFANHQDPAFAETVKRQYAHHMPKLYTPKIIARWETFFQTGVLRQESVEDITPFGITCPAHAMGEMGA